MQPRGEFRNTLKLIMDGNKDALATSPISAEDEATETMDALRRSPLQERIEFYKKNRIEEQRSWYAKKWQANKKAGKRWVIISILIYICAIISVLLRIAHPEWHKLPIEALIVLASSAIGWVQIKKFNELASAYSLTAQEIGIILSRVPEITSETIFSDFVNEAELAFSREHTQWVARLNEA